MQRSVASIFSPRQVAFRGGGREAQRQRKRLQGLRRVETCPTQKIKAKRRTTHLSRDLGAEQDPELREARGVADSVGALVQASAANPGWCWAGCNGHAAGNMGFRWPSWLSSPQATPADPTKEGRTPPRSGTAGCSPKISFRPPSIKMKGDGGERRVIHFSLPYRAQFLSLGALSFFLLFSVVEYT